MQHKKLWSYGDSHAAGHELGSVDDLGSSWIEKNYSYRDRDELIDKKGLDFYYNHVKQPWANYIENKCSTLINSTPCSPELSYAGEFSKLIEAEFVNRAVPGASNVLSMIKLLEDLEQVQKNDIVLFSLVTPHRFISGDGEEHVRTQIHWEPKKIQKVLYQYGPSDSSFNVWTQGIAHMVKSLHSNSIIIKTNDDNIDVNNIDTTKKLLYTDQSFTQYCYRNSTSTKIRYVSGHIHEQYHKLYADYLYKKWKN
jgi:hypothetical protein